MTHDPWERLLGRGERDSGYEAAFAQFDRHCDAVFSGWNAAREFLEITTHITNCAACREDTEGLLAALREIEKDSGK